MVKHGATGGDPLNAEFLSRLCEQPRLCPIRQFIDTTDPDVAGGDSDLANRFRAGALYSYPKFRANTDGGFDPMQFPLFTGTLVGKNYLCRHFLLRSRSKTLALILDR